VTRFAAALAITVGLGAPKMLLAQAPEPGSGPIDFSGYVRVIDGDTVEVYINGRQIGIGIVGIGAPEGNTDCGREATAHLENLLSAFQVRFEEDPITPAFDKRKRRMYRLILPDGQSAAVAMAETGLVRPTGDGIDANEIGAALGRSQRAHPGCVVPPGKGKVQ